MNIRNTILLPFALILGATAAASGFTVFDADGAAAIVYSDTDAKVVHIAARDLASDIELVSGKKPEAIASRCIVIGTLGASPRIDALVAAGKLDVSAVRGQWETFVIAALDDKTLVIAGSDKRGTAFGVYELSRMMGVSPWAWWADVIPEKKASFAVPAGARVVGPPSVKYRGIFINDEDWGLEPWASKTFEPEVGNIGPKTYSKIFELMLRLRGNYIWPGMHPTTRAFHTVPGNAAAADDYAIIVGSTHAEPMLLNNGKEWLGKREDFNYITNRDTVLAYWEKRVSERTSGESIFTIGMRGVDDRPIVGPKTQKERIVTLEKVFADQRELLARYLGNGDPTRVPQLFCPYKEVLDDYNAGLRVPDDVILVWPDDNYGYVRRYATPAERARSGGLGVYYHVSYSGMPQSWLWVDTQPPAIVWAEMIRAYEQGARALWIVNVGDLKNAERSTEFFLDLAWDVDPADTGAPARFMRETAARDFGADYADAVADILTRMQALSFERRAEHLQWHLSLSPYKPTEFNETEMRERLEKCDALLRDSDALCARLPGRLRDAYYQLVGYPVAIIASTSQRYFHSELARADIARGRSPDANRAAEAEGQRRIIEFTDKYNNEISGGKWRHVVTENGYTPKAWPRFQRDRTTPRPEPTLDNVAPPAPPSLSPLPHPAGARSGDFVERNGVVSINAGNFSGKTDQPDGAGWRAVEGLGRSGSAVSVMPSTAAISANAAPSLSYRFHVASAGADAMLHVRLLPTFPLVSGESLRFAVSIDDGAPIPLAITEGFETKTSPKEMTVWQKRVLSNATETSVKLPAPLAAGWHSLRLIAVDAGVVVDKFVFDFGGLQPSYNGPAETIIP